MGIFQVFGDGTMKQKNLRFKSLGLQGLMALGLIGLGTISEEASASVLPVICTTVDGGACAGVLSMSTLTTAVTSGFATTNGNIVAGNTLTQQQLMYLQTGIGGSPGGVTGLLSSINQRLGMVNNSDKQLVDNQDMSNRQAIYDEKMMEVRGSRLPTPTSVRNACVTATRATGRAGGARATGSAAAGARKKQEDRYDDNRPQIQALIDVAAKRQELGTCTATDSERNRPGCQGKGAGERPGADLSVSSLFTGGDPKSNRATLDEKGIKIADQVLTNMLPLPPDKLRTEKEEKSNAGIAYMLNYNRYVPRTSGIVYGMTMIRGFNTPLDQSGASLSNAAPFIETWAANRAEYEEIFGAGSFKDSPSESDLLRFDVFKEYAGKMQKQKESALSEDEFRKKQIEMMAVGNRINLAVLDRLTESNILLAVIASSSVDPLTSGEMSKAYTNATGVTVESQK